MQIVDVLTAERVSLATEVNGGVRTKMEALRALSRLLAGSTSLSADEVERVLAEREALYSTGVGGGVAIPHGSLNKLSSLTGAVLLCAEAVPFDAIDDAPVSIFFALLGPKSATAEHLKALARVSRLLRSGTFRSRLLSATSGEEAYGLIVAEESRGSVP